LAVLQEINHAGTGGLWAELVQNRGFEAGGLNTPSDIRPWVAVGTETQVLLGTDRSSPFVKNPVALRVAILCDAEDSSSSNQCPHRGVGVSNPGFWGMDIREGATYKVKFWLRSTASLSLSVSFTSADGSQTLAQETVESVSTPHFETSNSINKVK
jgi:alpha-N-arabinofuranosidase